MIDHLDSIKDLIKAYVLLNGQYVLYNDEVIYEKVMPVSEVKKLANKAKELNVVFGFVEKTTVILLALMILSKDALKLST